MAASARRQGRPESGPDFDLPPAPFLPGRMPRPDATGELFAIARRAPALTEPHAWRDNEAYLTGHRLFRIGYFWEAHEVWEPVWMNARPNSAERHLIQGLIQLANAGLKLAMDRPRAAARLARMAGTCLREAASGAPAEIMGVEPLRLASDAAVLAWALETGVSDPPFPGIAIDAL